MINCYLSGILGIALLSASISTMSVSEEQHNILRNTFSKDLVIRYGNIVVERRNHYVFGIILGVILSYCVLQFLNISNRFHRTSLFLTITLITASVFYFIMPKSDYMLNHLKTKEQNMEWLEVYKTMKYRYFIGFLLGVFAAIPLSHSLC
jgi:hypothetical protein